MARTLPLHEVATRSSRTLNAVQRAMVGKREALELAICMVLSPDHRLNLTLRLWSGPGGPMRLRRTAWLRSRAGPRYGGRLD
jgi:hypothetical protein